MATRTISPVLGSRRSTQHQSANDPIASSATLRKRVDLVERLREGDPGVGEEPVRALAVLQRAVRRLPVDGRRAELGHCLDEGALGLVEHVWAVVAEHDRADGDPADDQRGRGEREIVGRREEALRARPLLRELLGRLDVDGSPVERGGAIGIGAVSGMERGGVRRRRARRQGPRTGARRA